MRARYVRTLLLAGIPAALLGAACAGNPAPGDSGYRFNLQGEYDVLISVQGMAFTGTAELSTVKGGAVNGELRLTSPEPVTAELTGVVADSTFKFESTYTRSGGCEGALIGSGAIEAEGAGSSGNLDVADDCAGGIMEGSFELSRR
jgi:hypothetical protein